MRNFLFIIFTMLVTIVNGQFDKGYLKGHKDGYCNASAQSGKQYCNYNFTYIQIPTPKIGESYDSYTDGYKRVLYDGQLLLLNLPLLNKNTKIESLINMKIHKK